MPCLLSSVSAKSHLDEMNSHATVGAAIGLMSAITAMHSGESAFSKGSSFLKVLLKQ